MSRLENDLIIDDMSYLNKAMLIGRVGKDPDIRTINGEKVANFSLATSFKAGDKDITEWHNIVAWGKPAEVVEKYVRKGISLYVEGPIQTRSWEDQQGVKRYTTEIRAYSLQLLGSKSQEVLEDDLPD
jgi:single-strand DNA-binding protein